MDSLLIEPDSFDVIVLGSSLSNCLIAAALSKSKRRVLILEGQDCYGGESSSFTIHCLREAAMGRYPSSLTCHDGALEEAKSMASDQIDHDKVAADASIMRRKVPLAPFSLPIDEVTHVPGPASSPSPSRGYILDLMPKALYQGEALVDALVLTRAHHYLEFKRLEGSYIARADGQGKLNLQPIPASKSDVFRDKSLSIAEKRSLMTFLTSALEASRGSGRLKEALSEESSAPLHKVLQSEGLSKRLQDLILHGIIMSDLGSQADATSASIKASSGAKVLQLLADSMSRFGGSSESSSASSLASAFMVPSWGCGSISEAFVRCCAVSGGVTVLRCPVSSMSIVRQEGDQGSDRWTVEGVVTSKGQFIKCESFLITDPGTARQLLNKSSPSDRSPQPQHFYYRALVVMDGSLVEGQSSLSFVIPPEEIRAESSQGSRDPRHAIRGLQMSSAMGVCPLGQYLLYLSTPCSGQEEGDGGSYQGLVEAVRALLTPQDGSSKQPPRSLETFYYRQRVDADLDEGSEESQGQVHGLPHNLVTTSSVNTGHDSLCSHESREGVMGLMGHLSTLSSAERAFRAHFPHLEWLTDLKDQERPPGDDGEGEGKGEGGSDDEVDNLQAALKNLMPTTSDQDKSEGRDCERS